jgi:hypothetical protein
MTAQKAKAKAPRAKRSAKAAPSATRKPRAKRSAKAAETTRTLPGLPAPIQSRALVSNAPSVALAPIDPTAHAHSQQSEAAAQGVYTTRESWLQMVIETVMRPLFKRRANIELPTNIRVSVGFPSTGRSNKRIGEVWSSTASADKHFEIFLHVGLDTVTRALDVLIHELVHIAVGLQAGHGKPFKAVAVKLGLEGKMTATTAGEKLAAFLKNAVAILPAYPGAKLSTEGDSNKPKKQNTRMLKAECPCCGYTIRLTKKWAMLGLPNCICGAGQLILDGDIEDSGD